MTQRERSELGEVFQLLHAIDKRQAEQAAVLSQLAPIIKRHDQALYGNGKEGALTRVSILEGWQKHFRWLYSLVIGGIVAGVLAWWRG